jgi:hypothetical protein
MTRSIRRAVGLARTALGGGALALSVAACAGPATQAAAPSAQPPAPAAVAPLPVASPEEIAKLKERVATFWAARVSADAAKQWELLEPRGQGRMTAAEYGGVPRAVKYLAYQVEDANVRGYFATVGVRLIVQPILPSSPMRTVPPSAIVVGDKWVRIRGVWYRSLDQEETGTQQAGAQP